MASDIELLQVLDGRTFIQEGGPFGNTVAEYLGCAKMGSVTIPLGDSEVVYCPSPSQYRAYIPVDETISRPGTPTTEIMAFMRKKGVDRQARMAREKCPFVLYQNFGACTRPDDFDTFEKVLVISGARFTELGYSDVGTLNEDSEQITLTTPVSFRDAYQIVPISFAVGAGTEVSIEVMDVVICDTPSCGDCDDPSNGVEDIYAVTLGVGASPSNAPELIYSTDGGSTWNDESITTYDGSEGANSIACVGGDTLIVASSLGNSHSWATKAAPTVWTEVATGYVAGRGPRYIYAKSEREVFFAGRLGYVYKATDYTASVSVLEAGSLTVQDLNHIHGFGDTIVAVGASNALLYSTTNGATWSLLTGPIPAVALNSVFVKSHKEWWIAAANGNLYYTLDRGTTWNTKTFSGSGAGIAYDVKFVTPEVGYLSHSTAVPVARIFRTKDGGNTWRNTSSYLSGVPVAQRFTRLAVGGENPNFAVAVGLGGASGTDGIVSIGA